MKLPSVHKSDQPVFIKANAKITVVIGCMRIVLKKGQKLNTRTLKLEK